MRYGLLVGVVVALGTGMGHAQAGDFISGTVLARACSSTAPAEKAACDGYIAGSLDVVMNSPELKGTICPPTGVKLSALRETLGRFGQQHPDETKNGGVPLVHAMMKATYPCAAK